MTRYIAFVYSLSTDEVVGKAHMRDTAEAAKAAAKAKYLDAMLQSGSWIDLDDCEEAYEDDVVEGNIEIQCVEVAS